MSFFRKGRTHKGVVIQEYYKDYQPPFPITPVIRRLLKTVPEPLLVGLKYIVLTNTGTLNRENRRRKLKARQHRYASRECLGWYAQKWQDNPASIDILVDNVLRGQKHFGLRLNVYRDLVFGGVIYHEIGHHIHRTKFPEYKEQEDVAEEWRERLEQRHIWRRYWYIKIFVPVLRPVVGLILAIRKRLKRR